MYPNKQVLELRKNGNLEEALRVGRQALSEAPEDAYLKGAIAWVYFDHIKHVRAAIQGSLDRNLPPSSELCDEIQGYLREYARLGVPRPDMAHSQITRVLTQVGRHLDFYVPFLAWAGLDAYSEEDHVPYETDKGVSPSLITKAAREALHWVQNHPDDVQQWQGFLLQLADRALSNTREAPANLIWVRYDRAAFYFRLGDIQAAADEMLILLRQKRGEFWAWGMMARIEAARNPELAIACFAQSLQCNPEPRFTGKLHLQFASLLHEQGLTAEAIAEVLKASEIYQTEGWRFPDELETVLQAPWFNPDQANPDQGGFYRARSGAALALCYENISRQPATFLQEIITRKSGKPHWLFAVEREQTPTQLLVRPTQSAPDKLTPGTAVELTLGEDQTTHVMAIDARPDGEQWDCLQQGSGVVDNLSRDGNRGGVYLARDVRAVLMSRAIEDYAALAVGDALQVWCCVNPVRDNRLEVFHIDKLEALPSHTDIAVLEGELRCHAKGFGFMDDVFVPPQVVDASLDGQHISAICVMDYNKSRQEWGWRALRLLATQHTNQR